MITNFMNCKPNFSVSFDIGHSSIGWAVLNQLRPDPKVLGCGTVIFPKDDCLASQRRGYRRTRRNIRATRKRIANIKKLLLHLGVLDSASLDTPGHAAPHVLAARALLTDGATLSWQEIWHILRWYAHNRGYDGNNRWSRQEENEEDTEKEKAAKLLMEKHGTQSMAETVCAVLGIDPKLDRISSDRPFKTLNAAFPRKVVREEVLFILHKHVGHLPRLDKSFIESIVQRETDSPGWKSIPVPSLQLPKRYVGGLLFGQLVPRFDNRIISTCPISGEKVPNKSTREFLEYRWAMLLANIKADGKPLSSEQRQAIHEMMLSKGKLTPTELRQQVEEITGTTQTNIRASFEIHPDSKDALILDPVTALREKACQPLGAKAFFELSMFWPHLPAPVQKRAEGRWRKRRSVNLAWLREQLLREEGSLDALDRAIQNAWDADQAKKKPQFITRDHLLRKPFTPEFPSGRAPYSRPTMRSVVEFVLSTDRHPTEVGGPIYRSPEILQRERERSLSEQTNNHLIRHRLLLLQRLTTDIIKQYAQGDASRVTDIVIEVARDLQEFSGLTAKTMAAELTKRLSHFKSAVKYLQENAPDLPLTGSLIRKCRIAMDMNWECPFTGKRFDAIDLPKMEREHLIPFADRPTNALDAQVLTFDWVNRLKGKRTAMRFILDMAADDRFLTPQNYRAFVEKLPLAKKATYPDDYRRQASRKKWMILEEYTGSERTFTQGELTQTSHLNRLSQRQLERIFTDPATGDCTVRIHALPGQVTAEARKAWNLLGTLVLACPECRDKTKTEIREITHLHHALDAVTLALIHHYLPGRFPGQIENEKGTLWRALLQRSKSEADIALLLCTGVFKRSERQDKDGSKRRDCILVDLNPSLKNQIAARLAECRVVQHIPADQSGAILELNPWRVWAVNGDPEDPRTEVLIRQRSTTVENGKRVFEWKEQTERAGKLIGLKPGKLHKNKAVLVIAENYGLALCETPQIIPHHKVPERINALRSLNGSRRPTILRKGMLILIHSNPPQNHQDYTGVWRIESCKDNKAGAAIDIVRPAYVKPINKVEWSGMNKNIGPFIKAGLEILDLPLTGLDPAN